jgi:hypothetical protein
MKRISSWFIRGPEVQYGFDMGGLAQCLVFAALVLLAAVLHRALGFWFPHESPLRLFERDLSPALPSTIEHTLSAFAIVAFLCLAICGTKSTTRIRLMACLVWGLSYLQLSTLGWDWHQYVVSRDPAQLSQMVGDIVGVVLATFWLTRPVSVRRHVSRFRLSNVFR